MSPEWSEMRELFGGGFLSDTKPKGSRTACARAPCGSTAIMSSTPHCPSTANKQSGWGHEMGHAVLSNYLEQKAIHDAPELDSSRQSDRKGRSARPFLRILSSATVALEPRSGAGSDTCFRECDAIVCAPFSLPP